MHVLVTGGAGYIGSHAVVALLQAGHAVTILDNLSNGAKAAVVRAGELAGATPVFYEGDIRDRPLLDRIFDDKTVDAVMHFAGVKAVGEPTSGKAIGSSVPKRDYPQVGRDIAEI